MRSILVIEVVGGHVHRPARRLGGNLELTAHQLMKVPADGGLQLVGLVGVVPEILLGGVAALSQADIPMLNQEPLF